LAKVKVSLADHSGREQGSEGGSEAEHFPCNRRNKSVARPSGVLSTTLKGPIGHQVDDQVRRLPAGHRAPPQRSAPTRPGAARRRRGLHFAPILHTKCTTCLAHSIADSLTRAEPSPLRSPLPPLALVERAPKFHRYPLNVSLDFEPHSFETR